MSMDGAVRRGHPIIFGVLVLCSIIEMCISAFVTSNYNSHKNFPNSETRQRVQYILFMSIWTIVFGLAFLVVFLLAMNSVLVSVAAHFGFLVITWVLWLAAAAALTSALGGTINCKTQTFFVYCGQLNAMQAFAWIIWVLITITFIIVLLRGIQSAKRGDGMKGGLIAA